MSSQCRLNEIALRNKAASCYAIVKLFVIHILILIYVNYSNIAAKTLRKSLKSNLREEASKRDQSLIRIAFWVDGAPLHSGQKLSEAKSAEKT